MSTHPATLNGVLSTHPEAAHAALILEAAAGINSLNSALRELKAYETKDKKLAPKLKELLKLTERVLPRLVENCNGREADVVNALSNATAEVGRLLTYLDGAGMTAVVRFAEELARTAAQAQSNV